MRDQEQIAQSVARGLHVYAQSLRHRGHHLEDLIATALDDPQAVGENTVFRGIHFADLQTAYRQFCKNEKVAVPAVDLGNVIDFYNKAAADLPDHTKLKGMSLLSESSRWN